MTQHDSRKVAIQAIYLANQDPELTADEIERRIVASLNLKELSDYTKSLIAGVVDNRQELQADLAKYLKKGWRLDRMNQVTVAIMEVALYEINQSDSISGHAAINEALNLVEEFDDPKSKPFVNGVLANFVHE